jgi:uncharacterized SAM-binding protein YcdF (DUF218 family)
VSGGRRWGGHVEARVLQRTLVAAGVPRAAIHEELFSLSTQENAVFSAAILERLDARRAAVVTCPWHMARALANFRAAGVDAHPFPTGVAEMLRATRAYVELHEIVARRLDALRRTRVLVEAAARFEGGALMAPRQAVSTVETGA